MTSLSPGNGTINEYTRFETEMGSFEENEVHGLFSQIKFSRMNRKVNILMIISIVLLVIIISLVSILGYAYHKAKSGIDSYLEYLKEVEDSGLINDAFTVVDIIKESNLTKAEINNLINYNVEFMNAFGQTSNITQLVIDIEYLVLKTCSYLNCHSIDNQNFEMIKDTFLRMKKGTLLT